MDKYIITLGREYGSGGHEIGVKLAERLGIKCYDKEIIKLAAKNSDICEEIFQQHDEKPTSSFLYSLVMDTYSMSMTQSSYMNMPLNHKVFLAQFDAIKKLADTENCVIIGRCADYALEDYDNVIKVFIHAPLESRTKRICRLYNLGENKARDVIQKTDKSRASYYNYFTNKKWGATSSYDLCIDSSVLGIDNTVELIKNFVELRRNSDGNI